MPKTFEKVRFITPYSLRHPHTSYRIYYILVSTGRRLDDSRVTVRYRPRSLSLFTQRGVAEEIINRQNRMMNYRRDIGGAGDFQSRCVLRHWLILGD